MKDHGQRPLPAVADRADGRANLGGMMTVVVDHHNSPRLSFHFKASMDAGESAERFGHLEKWDFQLMGHRGGGERVGRAVSSREIQVQISQRFSMMQQSKSDACRGHLQILSRK